MPDDRAADSEWYEYIATVDFVTMRHSSGEPVLRIMRCAVADRHAVDTTPRHLLPLQVDGDAIQPLGLGMRFNKRRHLSAASINAALQAAGLVLRGFGFDLDVTSWATQDGVAVARVAMLPQGGQPNEHNTAVVVRSHHSQGVLNTTYRSYAAPSFRVLTSCDEGTGQLDIRVVKGHVTRDNLVVYIDEHDVSLKRLLRILEQYLDGFRPAASDLLVVQHRGTGWAASHTGTRQ